MTQLDLKRSPRDATRSWARDNFVASLTDVARGTLVYVCWLVMPACTWTSTDGTHHTMVVGLAIISSKTVGPNCAIATRSNLVGLSVQTGPRACFTLGCQSLQRTEIAPVWHGILIVTSKPGAALEVSASPVTVEVRHSTKADTTK